MLLALIASACRLLLGSFYVYGVVHGWTTLGRSWRSDVGPRLVRLRGERGYSLLVAKLLVVHFGLPVVWPIVAIFVWLHDRRASR